MKKTIKRDHSNSEKDLMQHEKDLVRREKDLVRDEEDLIQHEKNLVQHEKDSCDHKDCLCGNNKCRFRCALCVIVLLVACMIGEHIYRYRTNVIPPVANVTSDLNVPSEGPTFADTASTTVSSVGSEASSVDTSAPVVQSPSTLEQMLQPPDNAIDELKKKVSTLEGEVKRLSAVIEENVGKLFVLEEEVKKLSDSIDNSYAKAKSAREKWKIWINLKNKMEQEEDFSKELKLFYSVFAADKELISLVRDLAGKEQVPPPQKEEEGIIGSCTKYIRKIAKIKKISHSKLFEISGYVLSTLKTK
ncbi:hypothetical protein FACS189472_00970 [Alphaproteobacteria bacterium]|nr:hypothetical protein FACS189472_00970 [Alphaproteobacteria bacterium]